jgi:hypothetical protein
MTHITCKCTVGSDTILAQSDGQIMRVHHGTAKVLQQYQFSGAAVQWVQATPDGRTLAAGHACGLLVVFDLATGQLQDGNTCQLQSEYTRNPAQTAGTLSADGRWLLGCTQREEKDVGFLLDLQQQQAPRRCVLPKAGATYTPPLLEQSFLMLSPLHPTLLQCRIQSTEPLRHVQVQLVCSEHMELIGHYFDKKIDDQYFQKDILPKQFNGISWRIDMPKRPSTGSWLCTVILTASNNAGQVGHHVLSLDMPPV